MTIKDIKENEFSIDDNVVFVKSLWNSYIELDFGVIISVADNFIKVKSQDDEIFTFKKSPKFEEKVITRVIKL